MVHSEQSLPGKPLPSDSLGEFALRPQQAAVRALFSLHWLPWPMACLMALPAPRSPDSRGPDLPYRAAGGAPGLHCPTASGSAGGASADGDSLNLPMTKARGLRG